MASNPFNGVHTLDGGDFSSTDLAAILEKFEAVTEYNQIDLAPTLGTDWSTVAQGSGSAMLNVRYRLEFDANYQYLVNAWASRTTLTAVVRPRTGVAAIANPELTVTFQLPSCPPIPTEPDTVLTWEFSVKAITWAWTNGTLSVSRPS